MNRRNFLKTTAAAATTLSAASCLRAQGANDAIRLAVIGMGSKVKIGGMGRNDMKGCRAVPGVRIAALCDVDSVNLGYAVEDCEKHNEKPETFSDYRKLLEQKDIDAVWVTTPNHWHALICIHAAQAGKHVFVQKPVCHNLFEGRKMLQAARKYNRIVYSSTMTRSMGGFREASQFAIDGNLGKPLFIHAVRYGARTAIGKVTAPTPIPATIDYDLWCGPAPLKPLMRQNLHYDWHWDWEYGNGELGNWGIHLLDGARQIAGKEMPKSVLSVGGRFGYIDDGETPNTQITFFDYEPLPIIYEMRALPRDRQLWKDGGWGQQGMDTFRGQAFTTSIQCQDGYTVGNQAFDKAGRLVKEFKLPQRSVRSAFFDAIRGEQPMPYYDIAEAHVSTGLVHLGNISHRLGKEVAPEQIRERVAFNADFQRVWERMLTHLDANNIDLRKTPPTLGPFLQFDPATERFTGALAEMANQYLGREYRKGFEVPDNV
ncbi:MAG: Gfo/Idh/MocA family oxidoreductase [Kiritimatiellae bacterium]|nr:Gfo/Idh/MocA family oxidoreductase [Kiritimatiellia bacterium]